MNRKALRLHERGRTTQLQQAARSRRPLASARPAPCAARLTARWKAADGRLVLAWALEPERPPRRLITRNRGRDA